MARTKTDAKAAVKNAGDVVEKASIKATEKLESVKKAATTKAAETKEAATKAAEKTTAKAKKTADAAKTTAKRRTTKKSLTASIELQYAGKAFTYDTLVENAKNVWIYDMNRSEKEIKSLNIYVKPEENMVYFVVNDSETGKYSL